MKRNIKNKSDMMMKRKGKRERRKRSGKSRNIVQNIQGVSHLINIPAANCNFNLINGIKIMYKLYGKWALEAQWQDGNCK